MTYEEAIHHLCCGRILTDKTLDDELRFMCIDALEKQIPKKPKFVTKKEVYDPDRPFATINVTTLICPCCNDKIMFRKTVKRCLECGQLLDWSDEKCQEE